MEASHFLHIEQCEKREGGGAHCDHQTGTTHEGGRLVERRWTCCHCERRWTEEIKPLPELDAVKFVAVKHGPFAPPSYLMNPYPTFGKVHNV